MSFVVARMQKVKSGNLVGVGNHNQRNTDNHSNKDIDVERSHLNYDLVNRTENYKRDIEQFINDNKSSSRAVRKDAVLINEWIITSDNQFFKDKDSKEIKDYFEVAKSYFSEKFGDENIRYAQVHLDETTPHMHLGIVPFNDEHKLSAKTVFNRQALQAVQDELPKYLNERGFELERGEKGSERKNLTVPEYKKAKDELKELENKIYEHAKAVYEHECIIVDSMLSEGDIPFASKDELKAFARSRCNIVLNALGYKSIFNEDGDTISKWFYSSMNSFKLNDNFYNRGRNYKREFTPKDFDIFTHKEYNEVFEMLGLENENV